jgi:hypothetical protein
MFSCTKKTSFSQSCLQNREVRNLSQEEREHLIEWLSVIGNFGKDFLRRMSDEELEANYNSQFEK